MLKMRKIKLERIIDADMYIFFEKDTRGEISYIFNRYSQSSNKYWNLITKNKNQIKLRREQFINSNGYIPKSLTLINILPIFLKDAFLTLILHIQKSHENFTMISL